ncbi:MAG: flagellar hook-basal body protein [Deltaproteobacteria bacterium]|nr:flagellar hook-basal body protein [Deltaproteobacteria bacterium]
MIRAAYTAASGMIAESQRLDLMAYNLANVSTAGFKGAGVVRQSQRPTFPAVATDVQTAPAGQYQDPSAGSLRPTGVALDFALEGDGYFEVRTAGGPAYTRNGHFRVTPDGSLTDARGNLVLGETGPLKVASADTIAVSEDGTVSADGKRVDRLSLRKFSNTDELRSSGAGLFFPAAGTVAESATPRVAQQTLEDSNVSTMAEMGHMIETLRAFESYQKVITTVMDDVTGQAVRQLGRLA